MNNGFHFQNETYPNIRFSQPAKPFCSLRPAQREKIVQELRVRVEGELLNSSPPYSSSASSCCWRRYDGGEREVTFDAPRVSECFYGEDHQAGRSGDSLSLRVIEYWAARCETVSFRVSGIRKKKIVRLRRTMEQRGLNIFAPYTSVERIRRVLLHQVSSSVIAHGSKGEREGLPLRGELQRRMVEKQFSKEKS